MAQYKLCKIGVIRWDGVLIPADDANRHWRTYLQWVTAGNVPDAADAEPVLPTAQESAALTLQRDPVFRALIKVLAARFGLTAAQLINEIKAQV